jgi:small-conductance mechanosensitive channel
MVENVLRLTSINVNYGLAVKSDLQMTILRRFRAAGIQIPVMPHQEPLPGGVPAKPPGA